MSSGEGSCKLTNTAGYIVQIGLGFLIVAVLAYKRYTEKPRRHWKIWLLDVSKQCVSAATAHITNVGSALAMSNSANSDPCGWYFVTVVFETTLGVLICFFLITGLDKLFVSKGIEKYASGNYYRVEEIDIEDGKKKRVEIDYCVWFLQLIIWNLVVILSKTALLGLQFLLAGPLVSVSSSIFVGLDQFPLLKLILVMAVVPTIMNSLQFWVQDNFLKKTVKRSESKQIRELFFEDPEEEGEDYECDDFEYNKPKNSTPGNIGKHPINNTD